MVTASGIALSGNDWAQLDGRWPGQPPRVTVVVAHYEQQRELDRTLLALARQDHPAERLEIVVVDDGSAVSPHVPDGVTLVLQEDHGFRLAAARNVGARAANGDVLCFLDADTVPEPEYVRELTRLPALAPDVVVVGRRRHARLADLPSDARVEREAEGVELPSPRWLDDAYAQSRDLRDVDDRSYRFVIGAVAACDAAFFRETGGFDETFTEYGGEDWEWAHRAYQAGCLFAHVPRAVAWHDGPEWSARPEAVVDRKNREALLLAEKIAVPGSRPRGLIGPVDVVVSVPPGAEAASSEWFVTLDSIAADLPGVALPGDPRPSRGARILITARRPLRVTPGALNSIVERVAREGLAALDALDERGDVLCTVESARARARASRWGRDDLFPRVRAAVDGIDPVDAGVDVEAYLGGWG